MQRAKSCSFRSSRGLKILSKVPGAPGTTELPVGKWSLVIIPFLAPAHRAMAKARFSQTILISKAGSTIHPSQFAVYRLMSAGRCVTGCV
jgi:hypothetical protein